MLAKDGWIQCKMMRQATRTVIDENLIAALPISLQRPGKKLLPHQELCEVPNV